MSIGWVIFGKAIILALSATFVDWWKVAKHRRRMQGLPLVLNKRTGVYAAYCPFDHAERIAIRTLWIAGPMLAAYTVFVVWALLTH